MYRQNPQRPSDHSERRQFRGGSRLCLPLCRSTFYHESWRRDIADVLERLPPQPARIQAWAEAQGRRIKTVITPHVICRETEKEVADLCRAIVEAEDAGAVDGLMGTQKRGD